MIDTTSRIPSLLEKFTRQFSRTREKDPTTETSLDPANAINVLSFERRHHAIEYIATQDHTDTIPVGELAEPVTAKENDCSVETITSDQRSRVYISLIQQHAPCMHKMNLLEFDEHRQEITPTDDCAQLWRAYRSFRSELTG